MSRVYAFEEGSGRRFLVRLECDRSGCDASIKPHLEIADSGWMKRGINDPRQGGRSEWHFCPRHV